MSIISNRPKQEIIRAALEVIQKSPLPVKEAASAVLQVFICSGCRILPVQDMSDQCKFFAMLCTIIELSEPDIDVVDLSQVIEAMGKNGEAN